MEEMKSENVLTKEEKNEKNSKAQKDQKSQNNLNEELKKEAIVEIRPKFNGVYDFLENHVSTFVIVLLVTLTMIVQNVMPNVGITIIVIYLAYLIGITIYKVKAYKSSEYKFFKDKLIYNNKINPEFVELKYTDLQEIKWSQTFFQGLFKMGILIIKTNNKKLTKRYILIRNVKDVSEQYDKIVEILEKNGKKDKR